MFEYDENGNQIPSGGKSGFYNPQGGFGSNAGFSGFGAPNQFVAGGYNANPYNYSPGQTPSINTPYTPPSASGQLWNPAGQLAAAQSPAGAGAAAGATPAAGTSSFNPIGFGLGAVQTIGGIAGMRKLNKTPWPEYKASQGTLAAAGRAQQLSQMGYTPAQAAAFKANMGTALNTQFSNQVNMAGGGLAGALGARGTAQKLQAMNQFAATDAEKQMGNIRYADQQTANLQSLQNMQTQASMQRRMALENAYGAAIKQGSENMAGAFDTGAAFANMAKYFGRTS
jgi:hypothetical protein